MYGGADTFDLENCTVTQNHADERGGGIYSENASLTTGQINIRNSKIYGNEALKGGSDSCTVGNSINLSEELEKLITLYVEDDLVPLGWFFDYPTTAIEAPNSFDKMPVMLKMHFEEPAADPDPEPEEPDPTPEPEPTPTPAPSRPSGGYSRPSAPQEPEPEEPKEIPDQWESRFEGP